MYKKIGPKNAIFFCFKKIIDLDPSSQVDPFPWTWVNQHLHSKPKNFIAT